MSTGRHWQYPWRDEQNTVGTSCVQTPMSYTVSLSVCVCLCFYVLKSLKGGERGEIKEKGR